MTFGQSKYPLLRYSLCIFSVNSLTFSLNLMHLQNREFYISPSGWIWGPLPEQNKPGGHTYGHAEVPWAQRLLCKLLLWRIRGAYGMGDHLLSLWSDWSDVTMCVTHTEPSYKILWECWFCGLTPLPRGGERIAPGNPAIFILPPSCLKVSTIHTLTEKWWPVTWIRVPNPLHYLSLYSQSALHLLTW